MSSRARSRSPYEKQRRSDSPDRGGEYRKRKRDKGRDKYSDDDNSKESRDLPHNAKTISDTDYFLKNVEFRSWLKEEKDRVRIYIQQHPSLLRKLFEKLNSCPLIQYFDELSGEKARSYFRKFVKVWNRGKLPDSYYSGIDPATQSASSQTNYKWSFASKRSRAEQVAIDAARQEVGVATRAAELDVLLPSSSATDDKRKSGRTIGPTLPSSSDLTLLREAASESRAAESAYARKRARKEEKERIEDLVGPKETGREGMLEKKRARREEGRASQAAKDDVFGEYDEGTLMGGGDSFQARIAQRDAARRRFEEKRQITKGDRDPTVRERQEAIREKDKATMEMFKQMAKQRFG